MEEPPTKVTKFEMESQYLEGEVMEEGQEEWLSEGILTDDDYNPASQKTELDCSDSNIQDGTSHDETMNSASADDSQSQTETTQYTETNVSNIEETLNNLENSENKNQGSDFPEELNAFLIRKTDGKIIGSEALNKDSDVDESVKQSDDDGNDTDDLLRVLGDGDQHKQETEKEKYEIKAERDDLNTSDEDDSYIFEGKKSKTFNVAKAVLERGSAKKAEPEDDPTDCSSDEDTVKKIFTYNKKSTVTPQISTTDRPGNLTITPLQKKKENPPKEIIKRVVHVTQSRPNQHAEIGRPVQVKRQPNTARRSYVNKRASAPTAQTTPGQSMLKQLDTRRTEKKEKSESRERNSKCKQLMTFESKMSNLTKENQNEKEIATTSLLQASDKDLTPKAKESKPEEKQRLMRPEEMDEEVPTDGDSDESDEEDLYSELPSSDSDIEDWFTLDIRSERAGDYIPLLGDKAYQVLSEERRRVKTRLDTLKGSLTGVTSSGRELADQLREATRTVAELDAMLKVA